MDRGPDGFLPFGGQGRPAGLHEGAAIGVQVAREAFQEKGPTLTLFDVEDGEAPECIIPAPAMTERLHLYYEAPIKTPQEAGVDLEGLFEEALDPVVPLSGGGQLIIERCIEGDCRMTTTVVAPSKRFTAALMAC